MFDFQRINRTLPVMLLVAVMSLAVSCESDVNISPEISISENAVSGEAGYVFVDVTATGQWTLSIHFGEADEVWADLTSTEGSGSKDGVILRYEENTSAESRSLQVILTASGQDVAATFTQSGQESSGGDDPDPDPDPGFSENPGWLELPALAETEDCHFYWHDMTSGGKTVRNYSFLWDRENLVAHWVAYPLNTGLIGTGSRTDNWGYDPLVPRDEQPELYSGYDGGYDRGHQLPSADRLSANTSTFYFTNMTPQLGRNFNQGIWANFETRVRDWSRSSDTLYVVTGCVLEGSLGVAYDNLGKEVTVPGGYFKALLWYNHASTYSFGQYSAAGFYFDHRNYSGNSFSPSEFIMSIDDLEEITGIDFFVNLPARVGQSQADVIESADPSGVSIWN